MVYAIELLHNEETGEYRLLCGTDIDEIEEYSMMFGVEYDFDMLITERYDSRDAFDIRLGAVMKAYPGSRDELVYYWM